MTSNDIYNKIIFIENRIFGIKVMLNSTRCSIQDYTTLINRKLELQQELNELKIKLELNNLRKEKILELNNLSCH